MILTSLEDDVMSNISGIEMIVAESRSALVLRKALGEIYKA